MSEDKFRSSFRKKRYDRENPGTRETVDLRADSEEAFPSLSSSPVAQSKAAPSIPGDSTGFHWKRDSEKSAEVNIADTQCLTQKTDLISEPVLDNKWVVLTRDTVKDLLDPECRRDRCRYRSNSSMKRLYRDHDWEAWDDYLKSLSPHEYHELASSRIDHMVRIHERQKAEFISVYGYEYYAHLYMFKDQLSYEEENEHEDELTDDFQDEDGDGWESS
tara:strand:+ start:9645 stop:10298 length:654 start_codon:yes stop_codon:yes gene_type:complete